MAQLLETAHSQRSIKFHQTLIILTVTMISHLLMSTAMVVCSMAATTDDAEYDYVVIGSGPGGGSLAYVIDFDQSLRRTCCVNEPRSANLATSGYSVFLIEAGGDNSTDFREEIPSLCVFPVSSHLDADR